MQLINILPWHVVNCFSSPLTPAATLWWHLLSNRDQSIKPQCAKLIIKQDALRGSPRAYYVYLTLCGNDGMIMIENSVFVAFEDRLQVSTVYISSLLFSTVSLSAVHERVPSFFFYYSCVYSIPSAALSSIVTVASQSHSIHVILAAAPLPGYPNPNPNPDPNLNPNPKTLHCKSYITVKFC